MSVAGLPSPPTLDQLLRKDPAMDIYDPIAEALGVSPTDFIPYYSENKLSYIPIGGVPPWNKGIKMEPRGTFTEEHKLKLKEARNKRITPKHTEETKRKMSAIMKAKPGKPHSEQTKNAISNGNKGKKQTEETKKKIGLAVSLAAKNRNSKQ